jgi:hypothetical protein
MKTGDKKGNGGKRSTGSNTRVINETQVRE